MDDWYYYHEQYGGLEQDPEDLRRKWDLQQFHAFAHDTHTVERELSINPPIHNLRRRDNIFLDQWFRWLRRQVVAGVQSKSAAVRPHQHNRVAYFSFTGLGHGIRRTTRAWHDGLKNLGHNPAQNEQLL